MASGVQFRAKIDHNAKTIEKLYRARYYCYEKIRAYSRMGIGLVLAMIAAFVTMPIVLRGLLLLVGAWLLVSGDFPAQIQADKVLEARHGVVPGMKYEFYPDNFKITENGLSKSVNYKKISRLVTDFDYFYLFFTKDSCCMIDRKTISSGTDEELAQFLQDKSGVEWRQDKQLLSLNLYDIRNIIRDRNKR